MFRVGGCGILDLTTRMATKTLSQSPLSAKEAKRYAGQWIALRGGRVIASADSFRRLLADPKVKRNDAFFRVPRGDTFYF
jgi:hypothetical protein